VLWFFEGDMMPEGIIFILLLPPSPLPLCSHPDKSNPSSSFY
jgi:hypothetical protein